MSSRVLKSSYRRRTSICWCEQHDTIAVRCVIRSPTLLLQLQQPLLLFVTNGMVPMVQHCGYTIDGPQQRAGVLGKSLIPRICGMRPLRLLPLLLPLLLLLLVRLLPLDM